MPYKQVELPEIGIVKLYKRKGSRSIRLSIDHDGNVRVTLPPYVPYQTGLRFVRTKEAWINAQRVHAVPLLKHNDKVGKAHHLTLISRSDINRTTIRLKGSVVQVIYPSSLGPNSPTVQLAAKRASIKALRQEAENLLPQRLQSLALTDKFNYRGVSCKLLKSRWGSCNEQHDIVLNIFLMQLPWKLIDYVLLHELTHTRFMHHGTPFWAELGRHVPNVKELRKEIRAYRPILLA